MSEEMKAVLFVILFLAFMLAVLGAAKIGLDHDVAMAKIEKCEGGQPHVTPRR